MNYTIGQLSLETGCQVQTIRYYEEIGLLPPAARTRGNQRRFAETHRNHLSFIRHSRELGFSLETIRELLALADSPDASCDTVDQITRRHLEEINSRITRFASLKIELEHMLQRCNSDPEGANLIADCRILEVLSNHSLCSQSDHGGRPPPGKEP